MAETDLTVFRVYEPHECGDDGYPFAWHEGVDEELRGIKHLVRAEAEDRCLRCRHPFVVGESGSYERERQEGVHIGLGTLTRPLFDGLPEAAAAVANGRGEHWSPCDDECQHGSPLRLVLEDGSILGEQPHAPRDDFTVREIREVYRTARIEAAWRILTVHHLNERKHDCRWWNLAALCQRCHLTIQRKVQMERVYPFEHSDWFKPFAAGWYAYAYRGQELTREQAIEQMDDLLALEQMA